MGNMLDRAEASTDDHTEDNVTDLGHLAFGAAGGALFGLTRTLLPFPAMLVGPIRPSGLGDHVHRRCPHDRRDACPGGWPARTSRNHAERTPHLWRDSRRPRARS